MDEYYRNMKSRMDIVACLTRPSHFSSKVQKGNKTIMRILAFIFSVTILVSVSVVTAQSHLRLKEMIPSLSAEKDDGKDISDDETLSHGGRHLKKPETVEICRSPPGNPELFKTFTVLKKNEAAFVAKGALPGPCSEFCEQLCDDGNICTIDNPLGYDCEAHGCLPLESRAAIDCDGGNECTVATCSSTMGCEYHSIN
jgi:hypothetical protein